jgi:hypothetical protein
MMVDGAGSHNPSEACGSAAYLVYLLFMQLEGARLTPYSGFKGISIIPL